MARPKHNPKTDTHHLLVREAITSLKNEYQGLQLFAQDMSKMGGKSVDWTLWIGAFSVSLEVKTRGSERRMTKGETAFFEECPGVKRVVVTKEDVIQAIEDYAPIAKIVQSMVASSDQNPL